LRGKAAEFQENDRHFTGRIHTSLIGPSDQIAWDGVCRGNRPGRLLGSGFKQDEPMSKAGFVWVAGSSARIGSGSPASLEAALGGCWGRAGSPGGRDRGV